MLATEAAAPNIMAIESLLTAVVVESSSQHMESSTAKLQMFQAMRLLKLHFTLKCIIT